MKLVDYDDVPTDAIARAMRDSIYDQNCNDKEWSYIRLMWNARLETFAKKLHQRGLQIAFLRAKKGK